MMREVVEYFQDVVENKNFLVQFGIFQRIEMSTYSLLLTSAKEEVEQGVGCSVYDLPKKMEAGFLVFRGVLLLLKMLY